MNIYSTAPNDFGFFEDMFKKYGQVKLLPKNYKTLEDVDLVIFPGGNDVHPSKYNAQERDGEDYDEKRDNWELAILENILKENFHVKKVFGVCRGLQLLNVGFGGTLVSDIQEYYGKAHNYVHPIDWAFSGIFSSYLKKVNSLHHQCVEYIGDTLPFKILATESQLTGSIEAVVWKDKFFGVQFHPEYLKHMDVVEMRDKLAEHIVGWIDGKISVLKMCEISQISTARLSDKERQKLLFNQSNINPYIVDDSLKIWITKEPEEKAVPPEEGEEDNVW